MRKKRTVVLAILLLIGAMAAYGAYRRPVGCFDLVPPFQIDRISITVLRGTGGGQETRYLDLSPGDEAFEEMVERCSALRFRRTLLPVPNVPRNKPADGEAFHYWMAFADLSGQNTGWNLSLEYWVDEWQVGGPQERFLTFAGGKEEETAFHRYLWEAATVYGEETAASAPGKVLE